MTKPHLIPLNFENLAELDKGRLGLTLQKHLQTILADCINRPVDASGKSSPRKVLVCFEMTPKAEVDDEFKTVDLANVKCEVKIESKLPAHKSNPITMLPGKDGFYFNPDFPADPHQKSLLTGVDDDE